MLKAHRSEMGTDDTASSLAASIKSKLGALPTFSPRRCIYRVPKPLRATKHEAYTPSTVSIGPYHRDDSKPPPMEIHKLKYLDAFLRDSRGNGNLNIYLQFVKDDEALIRGFYADPITELSSDEFTEMVLIDAVFVIEIFRRISGTHGIEVDDFIYNPPRLISHIMRDILLEENQLPFFVLKGLYMMAFRPDVNGSVPCFTDIACKCRKVDRSRIPSHFDTQDRASSLHLLDLLRSSYLPSVRREEMINIGNEDTVGMILCPSITRLRDAGIKFQVATGNKLPDIHFDKDKAVLTIPKIIVDDETEHQLRNLIAFEQCHYWRQPYISDYQKLLDCLINTTKDVELLVEAGIIENWLGSDEEVSGLFNGLGSQVNICSWKYYYAGLTLQLNAHCNKRWNIYRATLKHTYFRHPWAVISVIYAVVLLVLTIVQVVTGILSVW